MPRNLRDHQCLAVAIAHGPTRARIARCVLAAVAPTLERFGTESTSPVDTPLIGRLADEPRTVISKTLGVDPEPAPAALRDAAKKLRKVLATNPGPACRRALAECIGRLAGDIRDSVEDAVGSHGLPAARALLSTVESAIPAAGQDVEREEAPHLGALLDALDELDASAPEHLRVEAGRAVTERLSAAYAQSIKVLTHDAVAAPAVQRPLRDVLDESRRRLDLLERQLTALVNDVRDGERLHENGSTDALRIVVLARTSGEPERAWMSRAAAHFGVPVDRLGAAFVSYALATALPQSEEPRRLPELLQSHKLPKALDLFAGVIDEVYRLVLASEGNVFELFRSREEEIVANLARMNSAKPSLVQGALAPTYFGLMLPAPRGEQQARVATAIRQAAVAHGVHEQDIHEIAGWDRVAFARVTLGFAISELADPELYTSFEEAFATLDEAEKAAAPATVPGPDHTLIEAPWSIQAAPPDVPMPLFTNPNGSGDPTRPAHCRR
ncbi:MAG: hypothetical protein K8T90_12695 [Planctomycetes bacterium]|nr:hypothetical protein [Planctomycetota bacterium]